VNLLFWRRKQGRCLSRGEGPGDLTHYLFHHKRKDCVNWTEKR
jgi:hypothetical protein